MSRTIGTLHARTNRRGRGLPRNNDSESDQGLRIKRILFFASNFNNWSGPNNHLLDLCNHLHKDMDLDICLITHNTKPDEEFDEQIEFPVLRILEGSASTPESRLLHAYPNAVKIREMISTQGVEANEVFVNSSIDTLSSACMAFRSKLATGYNVLSNNPNSILFNAMDKIAATIAVEKILANSQYHKKIYLKLGIDENRITVLPHCIDLKRIEKMSNLSKSYLLEEPTIVFVGRLTREKGLMQLIDAYEQISWANAAKLVIIGDGPLREYVLERKRVVERGPGRIEYLGWQPPNILLKEMNKATIVAIPSLDEAFGIVVLEAMCLSKPVITTSVGGLPEIIDDGINGLLIEPNNAEELANAITELLTDPGKCSRMGSNAYNKVENNFSTTKIAPKFLDFMEAHDD